MIAVPLTRHECATLRHAAWLHRARLRVEKAGKGRIGYVSLRSMEQHAYAQFAEQYYAVHDRHAL